MITYKLSKLSKILISVLLIGAAGFAFLSVYGVTCPKCNGAKEITGIQNTEVVEVNSVLVDYENIEIGCGFMWSKCKYDLDILLRNLSEAPVSGYLFVIFYYPAIQGEQETELLPAYRFMEEVKLEAMETKSISLPVAFQHISLPGGEPTHLNPSPVEVLASAEIECPYCNATGRVPLTRWLQLRIER